jgi:uncharacterized protein
MIAHAPTLDLVEFVESQILPRYAQFDRAHNMEHVTRVIRRSLELVPTTGADINMVYVIAAYHDLGMSGPRAIHHITGGRILANDARLKRWFSADQIDVMRQAVEDHRASASRVPRSIYGKIIAEADRDISCDVVVRRCVQYGLDNYPDLDREQQWQRFQEHITEKYSATGYIRLWIRNSPNERNLAQLRRLIATPDDLRQAFDAAYDQEKNK